MKVVITGFGACCALGENTKSLWHAIEQGHSGIAPIKRFDVAPFNTRLGAMVPAGDRCDTEAQRLLAYGCAAAAEALHRAKVIDRGRVALVLGTCNGLLGQEVHIVSTDLARALDLGGTGHHLFNRLCIVRSCPRIRRGSSAPRSCRVRSRRRRGHALLRGLCRLSQSGAASQNSLRPVQHVYGNHSWRGRGLHAFRVRALCTGTRCCAVGRVHGIWPVCRCLPRHHARSLRRGDGARLGGCIGGCGSGT